MAARPTASLITPLLLAVMAGTLLAGILVSGKKAAPLAWTHAPPEIRAVLWPEPRPMADFLMQTQHGHDFSHASLRGQWNFLFFGYLRCPDVCPLSLHAMREMRRLLIERNPGECHHQFIFVSVDPDNDTPDQIRAYMAHFDPDFIGVRGSMDETARLAGSLAVKFEEFVDDSGYRGIDHTSSLMIVDPMGRVIGALPPPLHPERMIEQFDSLRRFTGL